MAAVESPRPLPRNTVPPPTVASAGARADAVPAVLVGEDGFVSEATVDGWVRSGAASRAGGSLTVRDGRRFFLREALRVLGRRNGDTDPYGLTGRIEALRDFLRRGASLTGDALKLGPAVYDVEFGFVATPSEGGAPTGDPVVTGARVM